MPTRSTPRLRRMRYEPEPGAPPGPAHTSTRHVRAAPVPTEPVVGDPDGVRRALTGPLRLAMEVLDGRRPFTQLGRHFDAAALRYWRAAAHRRQVRAPARVLRVLLCLPGPGAAEVSAVCDIDGRIRALAARFERPDTAAQWRCTALRLG